MEITLEQELGIKPEIINVNQKSREVVEVCPHCEAEVILNWDVNTSGYIVNCPECGKSMMLCDECLHAEDNEAGRCDWCVTGNRNYRISSCFRGSYRI